MDLSKLLKDVGMSTFVKYYYDFQRKDNQECISIIEEPYTFKSKSTRTNKAKKIFREDSQIEALRMIINSKKAEDFTIEKAEEILSKETTYIR